MIAFRFKISNNINRFAHVLDHAYQKEKWYYTYHAAVIYCTSLVGPVLLNLRSWLLQQQLYC